MINCLIIDDEPLARDIIAGYIVQCEGLRLVRKCSNVMEAFPVLEKHPVDLIFLDIKMPVITGIDFARSIKNSPHIIFTTAFSEYAIDSYEVEAVDYLLKPVTWARFKKSIDKFLKQNNLSDNLQKNFLYIKVDGRLLKLYHRDILYAESMKDYLRVVTHREIYVTHFTMKSFVQLLPSGLFVRVHRSYVVNSLFVNAIGKKEIEVNGVKIPIGENYKDDAKNIKR